MSDTTTFGFPEAARRLGVPVRVLRHAIRTGKVAAPANLNATSALSAEWLSTTQAAVKAAPKALNRTFQQRVPSFARYEGTSAWRQYRNRVREYNRFQAAMGA